MGQEKTKILDATQVQNKLSRLAFEIYERNFQEKEIAIVGIEPNGSVLALLLKAELEKISPLKVRYATISLDKDNSMAPMTTTLPEECYATLPIILVDDVLNSGRTMFYGFKPFLSHNLKKLQIAVLVDRAHKKFPVSPDYVGYSLGTTLQEFVEVNLTEKESYSVYLL